MKQIALLDYDKAAVFIYDVPNDVLEKSANSLEDFLNSRGHSNFDWFIADAPISVIQNGFGRSGF